MKDEIKEAVDEIGKQASAELKLQLAAATKNLESAAKAMAEDVVKNGGFATKEATDLYQAETLKEIERAILIHLEIDL